MSCHQCPAQATKIGNGYTPCRGASVATGLTIGPSWPVATGCRYGCLQEVLRIIRAHMGDQTSPLLRFLLRYTLYLSFDPYASTAHRLRMLQLDYGNGFRTSLAKGPDAAELTVSACFYQSLFAEEGLPQLTGCCCCSQDSVWCVYGGWAG